MGFREAREAAGMSVIKVGEALGISRVAVYQWELGETRPTARRLVELAKLYGCTVDDLLKEDQ